MTLSQTVAANVLPGDLAKGKGPRLDQFLVRLAAGQAQCPAQCPAQCHDAPQNEELASGIEDSSLAEEELAEEGVPPCTKPAGLSRESIKRAIAEGFCRINGKVTTQPSLRLKLNDTVEFTVPLAEENAVPEEGDIEVLWEDRDLLVLSKPAGIVVHPCPSCPSGTLIQRILFHYPDIASMGGLRPGIVHRLDKETSGLLIVARNEASRLALAKAFAEREVHKEYLAIVWGRPDSEGSIDKSIGRHPDIKTRMACVPVSQGGREAKTDYTVLWTAEDNAASLIRVRIHSGRTHQIRVHMTSLGHPLLGDATYAEGQFQKAKDMAPRVMLHAFHLTFAHPAGGREMEFFLPPPSDMEECLLSLACKTQCVVVTGSPGSGKSSLLRLFSDAGISTISADELVSGYYAKDGPVASFLHTRFGDDALTQEGSVDRAWLMQLFTEEPGIRRETEAYVHALVLNDIEAFFKACTERNDRRCVAEIPLYFECAFHKKLASWKPLCIGVRAGIDIRTKRLSKNRGWSGEKCASIESWQFEEEKKLSWCQLVADNTGREEDLGQIYSSEIVPALDSVIAKKESSFRKFLASVWGTRRTPGK